MENMKSALVTGATGAIGFGIAKLIAENHQYKLTIVSRNVAKAINTVESLQRETGNKNIDYVIADLSRKHHIKKIAEKWKGPLHVLVNDAGITPRKREESPEGIELQWATNVLGYYWMIKYFIPHLERESPTRIINVASYWAGDMNINDIEFKKRYYHNDTAYRQSKQADRMLAVAYAEILKPKGITVNACHPGDVRSTLASTLGYGGHESAEQGAATPVWLAVSPEVEGITGKYFEHKQESTCRFGANKDMVKRLFDICQTY